MHLTSMQNSSCSGSHGRKKLPCSAAQSSLPGPYPAHLEIRENAIERHLWKALVQPPAQHRANFKVREGYSGPCPEKF